MSCQQQTDIAAVAVADHVHRPDIQYFKQRRRIVGHLPIGKCLIVIRTVSVAALIDADHRAKSRKVGELFDECAIEVTQPAMQEDNRSPAAADFREYPDTVDFIEAAGAGRRRAGAGWLHMSSRELR